MNDFIFRNLYFERQKNNNTETKIVQRERMTETKSIDRERVVNQNFLDLL